MQTIVGFQQDILKILKLNCVDAVILEWLVYFADSKHQVVIHEEDGKKYYWVKYSKVFADLLLPFNSNFKLNQCFARLCGEHNKTLLHYPLKKYIKNTTKGRQIGFSIDKDVLLWIRGERSMSGFSAELCVTKIKSELKDKNYNKVKAFPDAVFIFEELMQLKINTGKKLFPHRLPTDEHHYENVYKNFQDAVLALYDGVFLTRYNIRNLEKWFISKYTFYLKDYEKKIRLCKGSWANIKKLFLDAGNNYVHWFDIDSEVQNKDSLPRHINNWIYNTHANTSMFYICLSEPPTSFREADAEKIHDSINVGARNIMLSIYNDNWDNFIYWNKVKNIINWYEKHAEKLCEKDTNCMYWLGGGLNTFLRNYKEWLLSFTNTPHLGNIGIGNKTWSCYTSAKAKEHDISINIPTDL